MIGSVGQASLRSIYRQEKRRIDHDYENQNPISFTCCLAVGCASLLCLWSQASRTNFHQAAFRPAGRYSTRPHQPDRWVHLFCGLFRHGICLQCHPPNGCRSVQQCSQKRRSVVRSMVGCMAGPFWVNPRALACARNHATNGRIQRP